MVIMTNCNLQLEWMLPSTITVRGKKQNRDSVFQICTYV